MHAIQVDALVWGMRFRHSHVRCVPTPGSVMRWTQGGFPMLEHLLDDSILKVPRHAASSNCPRIKRKITPRRDCSRNLGAPRAAMYPLPAEVIALAMVVVLDVRPRRCSRRWSPRQMHCRCHG